MVHFGLNHLEIGQRGLVTDGELVEFRLGGRSPQEAASKGGKGQGTEHVVGFEFEINLNDVGVNAKNPAGLRGAGSRVCVSDAERTCSPACQSRGSNASGCWTEQ